MEIKQDYPIWILIALLCILKIFVKYFYKDIANDVERLFDLIMMKRIIDLF